jgi:two-component system sensor histidine kinase QseC
MTRWFSLSHRLLLAILGGASVGWLATLWLSYLDTHLEIDELFDAQLVRTAQALLAQREDLRRLDPAVASRKPVISGVEEAEPVAHPYQVHVLYQVFRADGALVIRSGNAPERPISESDGFTDVQRADGTWRVYGQQDRQGHYRALVAEFHQGRLELAGKLARRLLLPALVGLPLLGLWIWLAIRRGLSPMRAIASQIAARRPEQPQALMLDTAPDEVRPLVEEIDRLFARVGQALDAERRFTADAAHELRTPLAALATQAQVALRARDAEERRHALEQLATSTRRAARLVDQLLTLARLDPAGSTPAAPVAMDQLAEEVCADHGAAALAKEVELELEAEPTTVAGNPDMLRVLLRNLVDNAIRYTPAGGRVTVAVAPGRLVVTDTGPGIPAEERQRVFDRFHRLAGQEIEGSGLGLSIVARVAEQHRARLILEDGTAGRGLRVTVAFPG